VDRHSQSRQSVSERWVQGVRKGNAENQSCGVKCEHAASARDDGGQRVRLVRGRNYDWTSEASGKVYEWTRSGRLVDADADWARAGGRKNMDECHDGRCGGCWGRERQRESASGARKSRGEQFGGR